MLGQAPEPAKSPSPSARAEENLRSLDTPSSLHRMAVLADHFLKMRAPGVPFGSDIGQSDAGGLVVQVADSLHLYRFTTSGAPDGLSAKGEPTILDLFKEEVARKPGASARLTFADWRALYEHTRLYSLRARAYLEHQLWEEAVDDGIYAAKANRLLAQFAPSKALSELAQRERTHAIAFRAWANTRSALKENSISEAVTILGEGLSSIKSINRTLRGVNTFSSQAQSGKMAEAYIHFKNHQGCTVADQTKTAQALHDYIDHPLLDAWHLASQIWPEDILRSNAVLWGDGPGDQMWMLGFDNHGLILTPRDGPPFGRLKSGYDSVYEIFRERVSCAERSETSDGSGAFLSNEDCAQLSEDAAAYSERMKLQFRGGDLERGNRDFNVAASSYNLIEKYASHRSAAREASGAQLLLAHTYLRALAARLKSDGNTKVALDYLKTSISRSRRFAKTMESPRLRKLLTVIGTDLQNSWLSALPENSVMRLEFLLKRAVKREDYEAAARYRDQIAGLTRNQEPR